MHFFVHHDSGDAPKLRSQTVIRNRSSSAKNHKLDDNPKVSIIIWRHCRLPDTEPVQFFGQ